MTYTGRIIGISLVISITIIGRILAYIYLDYPFTALPIPALCALPVFYLFGKKYDQVKFYSERDILTHLYNRRFMYQKFTKLLKHPHKNCSPIAILLLDCDKFKNINDAYGHMQGDLVLKEIAAILLASQKSPLIISRWGGDEFLILQYNADKMKMQLYIREIKHKLDILSQRLSLPISVSYGFAIHYGNKPPIKDLIVQADQMMYKNKRPPADQKTPPQNSAY